MSNLTWNETRAAIKLMRRRMPIHNIVKVLGNKYFPEEIDAAVIALRKKEREKRALYNSLNGPILRASDIESRSDVQIPDDRIAERDHRRSLFPISLTARMMGDPLPGYSAADRAPSITPSIHHDPLDDLMFSRRKAGMRYG